MVDGVQCVLVDLNRKKQVKYFKQSSVMSLYINIVFAVRLILHFTPLFPVINHTCNQSCTKVILI